MKQLLLILAVVMGQSVLAADKKPLTKEESAKAIEGAIRKAAKKPIGELTKADLEKVTRLNLFNNQLADVKGLERLTQLEYLNLNDNPDLTKAQIDELQKALPKCRIYSNPPLNTEKSAEVIEAAIRKELKKPKDELTKADLEKVTKLSLSFNQLTEVKGLEKLTKLKELDLDGNQLTDVKGLEKLTQLRELSLVGNQLTEVKGLKKRTQLKMLYLESNQLTDVKGLEKLTQLTELYLGDNQLTDVKGLENLTQVKMLSLSFRQLTELPKELEKLTKLTGLHLTGNKLTEVPKGLENLTQLEALYLDDNQLTDVKGLEKLTRLTLLVLFDNPALTKAQIDQLQKALPKCKILHNATN